MKKTRLSNIILLVLTLLCSIFILASCGGGGSNNGDNPTPSTPTKLTAPTVVLTDDTATWSTDASADKFEISIDGNLSYIENSVTSRKLTDGQTFKIRAIGDGTNYTNSDWSNSVIYAKPIPKYTIAWKNGDTVLETDTEVSEGTVPTYDGAEPTKAADAQYSYVFAGWTPEVVDANGDVTYTAVFTSVLKKYNVTFKNYDGSILYVIDVTYGSKVEYLLDTPSRADDSFYSYTFTGWDKETDFVTGDIEVIAQYFAIEKYMFIFSPNNNLFETNNSTEKSNINTTTNRGDIIGFEYSNYKKMLGRWGQLNPYGYLKNIEEINGISSLIVKTTNPEDELIVSFGYQSIDGFAIFNQSILCKSNEIITLEIPCSYIKIFNASSNSIIIDEICINYENKNVINPFPNDALLSYKVNNDNISCIITGVVNSNTTTEIYLAEYYQGYKVANIADAAFSGCSNLEKLQIPFINSLSTENPNGSKEFNFGRLFGTQEYENSTRILQQYYSGNSYNLSDNIRYVSYFIPTGLRDVTLLGGHCSYSFYNCTMIESITFGDLVAKIGNYCLSGCSSLKYIDFGCGASEIGYGAFRDCTSLTSINLESNVAKIGYRAFENCTFETLIIPDNITTLSDHAFYGCTVTKCIYISKSVTSIGEVAFNYLKDNKPTIYCSLEYPTENWDAEWNYYNYPVIWGYYMQTEEYLVTSKNDRIGLSVYYGENGAKVITPTFDIKVLPNYSLQKGLFIDNDILKLIELSEQCSLIESYTFENCDNLQYVVIYNGNIIIEDNAFAGYNQLECLYFAGNQDEWHHEKIYQNYIVAFYSETLVSNVNEGIYYWHYVDGVPKINY